MCGANCRFAACNHGVQPTLAGIMGAFEESCTQQTRGLTRGMTLRAIPAPARTLFHWRLSFSSLAVACASPLNIACKTLPCTFTRSGLPPLISCSLNRHDHYPAPGQRSPPARGEVPKSDGQPVTAAPFSACPPARTGSGPAAACPSRAAPPCVGAARRVTT